MTNAGIIQKQQAAAAVKAKNPTIQDMIRKMGGEIEKERVFDGDPYYESMKQLG